MKVLQINTFCGRGSTGRITVDLAKALQEGGHESLIAYGRGKAPDGVNAKRFETNLGNDLHGLRTRLFDGQGFGSAGATKRLIRLIDSNHPDLIHLHNLHGYYINVKLLFDYLKEAGLPVVWTLHDCWAFTGHCAHFDYAGCDRWKTCCAGCPQKKEYPSSFWMDRSTQNYLGKQRLFTSVKNMTVVTPSVWLAGLAESSFLGKYPIRIIPNGIDLEMFRPTESGLREKYHLQGRFVVLGVASEWGPRKGLDYFVELSKNLSEEYKIIVVGVTEKQKKDLPSAILSIQRTDSAKELAQLYSAADLFVNPTLEDNFPTTNLEALACGTPVLTFNTGGSPESLDDTCGLIVEKGNKKELLTAVKKLRDGNLSSAACLTRVKRYEAGRCFHEYIKLYRTMTS